MWPIKSAEEAKTRREQITELGDLAGFHVRKWISHQPKVIKGTPDQHQAAEIDFNKTEFPVTKMLVACITQEVRRSSQYPAPSDVFTNRSVSAKTTRILAISCWDTSPFALKNARF